MNKKQWIDKIKYLDFEQEFPKAAVQKKKKTWDEEYFKYQFVAFDIFVVLIINIETQSSKSSVGRIFSNFLKKNKTCVHK